MSSSVFSDLVGQTIVNVWASLDEVRFVLSDGRVARLYHYQNCCESVDLHDVAGEWDDLVGTAVVLAEEVNDAADPADVTSYMGESHTWTFYRIGTVLGTVVMRWIGRSNGYCSESVSFDIGEAA